MVGKEKSLSTSSHSLATSFEHGSAIGYCYNRGKSLSAMRYLHCRLSGSMHESMARDMGTITEYPAHNVCPRRHSLKNESEYDTRSSYANKRAGYSAI